VKKLLEDWVTEYAKRINKMKIMQMRVWAALMLGTLAGLGAALPTVEDADYIEERGALEPRVCGGDNCLRALRSFGNANAATSFCGDYIPKGVYTTVVTTQFIYESLEQFQPTITTDYLTTYTYTNLVTIGAGQPIFGPPPLPTSTSISGSAPTPTLPTFLKACDFESKKISSACSCIVSSVTTVLQVENYYIEDIFPYTGPPFSKDKKDKRKSDRVD